MAVTAIVLAGVAPLGAPVKVEVNVMVEPSVVGFAGFAATAIVGVDRAAVAVTICGVEVRKIYELSPGYMNVAMYEPPLTTFSEQV